MSADIVQVTVPSATAGQAYSFQFTATGGTPPYTFTTSGWGLPPGLSLSLTGLLSGTPLKTGTFAFTVCVLDSCSCVQYTVVNPVVPAPLSPGTRVQDILNNMALHLVEPSDFSTGLWTQSELIGYIGEAEQEFLVRTGIRKTVSVVDAVANQSTYTDPADAIEIDRISWNNLRLYPQTRQELDWQSPTWRKDTARNPRRYHQDGLPVHHFEVWPAPTVGADGYALAGGSPIYGVVRRMTGTFTYTSAAGPYGTIRSMNGLRNYWSKGAYGVVRRWHTGATNFIVIHDQLPRTLSTPMDLLTIPDAFRMYVTYGALSRAWLKEGDGQDQVRGLYARERFDRGVWLTRRIVFGVEGPWPS